MPALIDMTGQRFGRLTVLARAGHNRWGHALWTCRCVCKTECVVAGYNLRNGHTQSCGCRQRDDLRAANAAKTTHGHARDGAATRTYVSWVSARTRCRNPHNPDFAYYGGRGIAFSPQFDDYSAFLLDMGERPEGMTLDRIDPDGDYEPGNVRWSTPLQQTHNRRPRVAVSA